VLLSETATALLLLLRSAPDMVVCEGCSAEYLGVARDEAMKAIRDLILNGVSVCEYDACVICEERRAVVRLRRLRWGSLPEGGGRGTGDFTDPPS